MISTTTTKKIRSALHAAIAIFVWLTIWQIIAIIVDREYFLPDVFTTLKALGSLVITGNFWLTTLYTLLRVITGLSIGTALGILLAVLAHHFVFARSLLSPIISVIKSTPVASFIVILWIMMNGTALAILIAVLMVMPIIWQNLMDAYSSIDRNMEEVAAVFEFSFKKRMKLIVFPALKKYFVPALVSASGLAWKSEIAAEIIAYTKDSIGQKINDAKYYLDTPSVFAWTLVVVFLSIILESVAKYLLRRYNR